MKTGIKIIIQTILIIVPLILGTAGFLMDGIRFSDSMYNTATMFFFGYAETADNIFIELARWLAPVATASGIILCISKLAKKIFAQIIYHFRDTAVVYGDELVYDTLAETFDGKVFKGENGFIKAKRYVLCGTEDENAGFIVSNKRHLKNRNIWVKSDNLYGKSSTEFTIKPFYPENISARVFWNECNLYENYTENPHNMKIAIIGFGTLGRQLLLTGLQYNIFSVDQCFEYHVFGSDHSFEKLYYQLDKMEDKVIFYDEPWQVMIRDIDPDMIIICNDKPVETVQDVLFATNETQIAVFLRDIAASSLVEDDGRCMFFEWERIAYNAENLFDEATLRTAKKINLRYSHTYSGTEETPENAETEWNKLSTFTKYSNISCADYNKVRLKMVGNDINNISANKLETLSILEHIRWDRFHYLNNWQFGIPGNGKVKDAAKRIHANLVPYDDLTEEDKQKDRNNVMLLLGIELNQPSSSKEQGSNKYSD